MYKCPKCDYKSENPGTCPTDNEVLQEEIESSQPSAPEQEPVPETPETTTEPEEDSTPNEGASQ